MSARISNVFRKISRRVGKDPAVTKITVEIDTAQWSNRKKNIICEAVLGGQVTACGYNTAELIEDLLFNFDCAPNWTHSRWYNALHKEFVDPEKWDGLLVHVAAAGRLNPNSFGWFYRNWERDVSRDRGSVTYVPLPHDKDEAISFAEMYIRKAGPKELANRQRLVDAIRNNETLTIVARKD